MIFFIWGYAQAQIGKNSNTTRVRKKERERQSEGDSKLWLVLGGVVVPHQPAMLTLLLLSIFYIHVCIIIYKDYNLVDIII